jgi:hypothetical protein
MPNALHNGGHRRKEAEKSACALGLVASVIFAITCSKYRRYQVTTDEQVGTVKK